MTNAGKSPLICSRVIPRGHIPWLKLQLALPGSAFLKHPVTYEKPFVFCFEQTHWFTLWPGGKRNLNSLHTLWAKQIIDFLGQKDEHRAGFFVNIDIMGSVGDESFKLTYQKPRGSEEDERAEEIVSKSCLLRQRDHSSSTDLYNSLIYWQPTYFWEESSWLWILEHS